MDKAELLTVIQSALVSVTNPHHYEDERGFQGELYAQLRMRLNDMVLPESAILRQEYQKQLDRDGLRIRPDIILHEPFDARRHENRKQGNLAVMELKRRATLGSAVEAFNSLIAMIETLNYMRGIFINVDSSKAWRDKVPDAHQDRIDCFAVFLDGNGEPQLIRA